jgi:hypothetical protein
MGQRVLMTAGANGIGLAIAEALAADDARVHIADIDGGAVTAVTGKVENVTGSVVDVSKPEAVGALFDGVGQHLGCLDVLVNNAGIAGPTAAVEEYDATAWRAVVRGQPDRDLPGHPRRHPVVEGGRRRHHRDDVVAGRTIRLSQPGRILHHQVGAGRLRQDAGDGAGPVRDYLQHHPPGCGGGPADRRGALWARCRVRPYGRGRERERAGQPVRQAVHRSRGHRRAGPVPCWSARPQHLRAGVAHRRGLQGRARVRHVDWPHVWRLRAPQMLDPSGGRSAGGSGDPPSPAELGHDTPIVYAVIDSEP